MTFEMMCDDISKIDFDVALLGCGGYGLPLCNYIRHTLGKSAIYVGGGLQLLFGVMGSRVGFKHRVLATDGKRTSPEVYSSFRTMR